MNNNECNQKQLLQLEKAYTFLMVPFYYENDDWNTIHEQRLDKWLPISSELYNEDVLYPYIMDLFKQHTSSQKTRLDIYEFNSEDKGVNSSLFVNRILGKKHIALIGKNAEEKAKPVSIQFRLMNENNFAPHLFISPSAKIGILTFSIELLGNKNMEDLNTLNYYLHKRNEINKYQCVCLKPEKQEDDTVSFDYETINKQIPGVWKQNQKKTMKNQDYVCWNINDFVDCLLATMGQPKEGQKRIHYFSKDRIHLFTFCSLQDMADTMTKEDVTPYLLRLSRCVNTNYMLPYHELVQEGALLQTYENIFFSSSIEGTAMMCIGKKDNSAFIQGIHEKFNRQYLLIYILVLIQRYTLQSLERLITEVESTDEQSDDKLDKLWELIDIICRIKVNCYYTDVSIYTHHSQFYQHCCKNLHIPETFNEVGEKINLLKLTTDRKVQKIQEKSERLQKLLNIVVAILTVAQVMQAVHELSNADNNANCAIWAGGICLSVIAIAYLWSYYKDSIFKKCNR